MREKINIEKYITVTRNKEKEFRNEWKFFLSLYNCIVSFFFSTFVFWFFVFATYLVNNLLNSRKLIPYVFSVINKQNSYYWLE